MKAKFDKIGGSCTHTFNGSGDEVSAAVDDVMTRYHPMGYGTWVDQRVEEDDGSVTVVVKRYASCD